MGLLHVFPGVDGAVFACILLLCINKVLSAPKKDSACARDDSIGQGIREPTKDSSSLMKMFYNMSKNMAHGMGRMYPAVNQMHDQSDNLYQEVQRLHDQLIDSHKPEETHAEERIASPGSLRFHLSSSHHSAHPIPMCRNRPSLQDWIKSFWVCEDQPKKPASVSLK